MYLFDQLELQRNDVVFDDISLKMSAKDVALITNIALHLVKVYCFCFFSIKF